MTNPAAAAARAAAARAAQQAAKSSARASARAAAGTAASNVAAGMDTQLFSAGDLAAIGQWTAIGGALIGSIGSYYAADAQKDRARSQAITQRYQASVAQQNARLAEDQAQRILRNARFEKGKIQLAGDQERGRMRAQAAARGGAVGVGSAAEAEVSRKLIQEIDELTIDINANEAAAAQRMRAVDLRGQAALGRVSARNLDRSAGTISPGLAATTTLLGSASRVSGQIANDLRWQSFAENQK